MFVAVSESDMIGLTDWVIVGCGLVEVLTDAEGVAVGLTVNEEVGLLWADTDAVVDGVVVLDTLLVGVVVCETTGLGVSIADAEGERLLLGDFVTDRLGSAD